MSPNSDTHDPGQTAEPGGNLKIIDLEFETLRQFRELMAPRLNYEGFFVATENPLPKGTPARFRFLLPDGFVLVEGTAVVAWTRPQASGPDDRAGMALLFNELQHQSREIVDELIDFHIATGGDPFEIGAAISEPGDIGTDALMGDSGDAPVPAPEPEPEPEPAPASAEAEDTPSEEFLPDWLSEVAQKHDVDLSSDVTVPVGGVLEAPEAPEDSQPAEQEFEVSLMPEAEEPDETPFQTDIGAEAEVAMPAVEKVHKPPRDLRLWPFVAAAVIIIAASAIVWWIVNRTSGEALLERPVVVEETPVPAEPTPEVVEEAAVEPSVEPPEEAVASEPEPATPPLEVAEGPATRVLLVAATRVADATIVTVRTNGDLSEDSVRVSRLKDPARVWIRIQGIETFYRPNDIEVGTPEMERVRVGHHPEETPQSIYVVCDLAGTDAVIREHSIEGDTLRVIVGRR
jgi:hypothetical protein